jgi:hypothetical protein
MVLFLLFYIEKSCKCRNVGMLQKSYSGIGISSGMQLPQSGIRVQSGTAGHGLVRHCPATGVGGGGIVEAAVVGAAVSAATPAAGPVEWLGEQRRQRLQQHQSKRLVCMNCTLRIPPPSLLCSSTHSIFTYCLYFSNTFFRVH